MKFLLKKCLLLLDQNNTQNVAPVRTDAMAATKAEFGNYRTYRDAKEIIAQGVPELIAAVESEQLSIFRAAKIARYSPEKQHYFLMFLNNKKQMIKEMEKETVKINQEKIKPKRNLEKNPPKTKNKQSIRVADGSVDDEEVYQLSEI